MALPPEMNMLSGKPTLETLTRSEVYLPSSSFSGSLRRFRPDEEYEEELDDEELDEEDESQP